MSDTHKRGVAHRHPRPMPSRRRFGERLVSGMIIQPTVDYILSDDLTFGMMDLRDLVDGMDNEGED